MEFDIRCRTDGGGQLSRAQRPVLMGQARLRLSKRIDEERVHSFRRFRAEGQPTPGRERLEGQNVHHRAQMEEGRTSQLELYLYQRKLRYVCVCGIFELSKPRIVDYNLCVSWFSKLIYHSIRSRRLEVFVCLGGRYY